MEVNEMPVVNEDMAADWKKLAEARGELLTLVMQEDSANRAELAEWKKLAEARGTLLMVYRTGGKPSNRALDDAQAAQDQLRSWGKL